MTSLIQQWGRRAVYGICGFFLLWFIWRYAVELRSTDLWPYPGWFLISVLSSILASLGLATAMWWFIRSTNTAVGWRPFVVVYLRSNLARYVPGGVWGHVARYKEGQKLHIAANTLLYGLLLEAMLLVGSGLLVGIPFLTPNVVGRFCLGGIILSGLFLVNSRSDLLVHGLARLLRRNKTTLPSYRLSRGQFAVLLLIYGAVWLFFGGMIMALSYSLAADLTWWLALSSFALAYVLGFVTIFAPSGIGVREVVLTSTLKGSVGVVLAGLLAVWSRLLMTIGELGALGLVSLLKVFV